MISETVLEQNYDLLLKSQKPTVTMRRPLKRSRLMFWLYMSACHNQKLVTYVLHFTKSHEV